MVVSLTENTRSAAELAIRVTPQLSRWIQLQMTNDEEHDLSMRQLSALQFIDGTETTLGDVARNLNVTPAVVTGLIDRLERRGYVRRVASVFDRRRVYIELTTAGEDVRDHAEDQLAKRLEEMLAKLSDEEVAALVRGACVHQRHVRVERRLHGHGLAGERIDHLARRLGVGQLGHVRVRRGDERQPHGRGPQPLDDAVPIMLAPGDGALLDGPLEAGHGAHAALQVQRAEGQLHSRQTPTGHEELGGQRASSINIRCAAAGFPTGKTFDTWDEIVSSIPTPDTTLTGRPRVA